MILAMGACLTAVARHTKAYEALRGPTEMRYWDRDKAYNGYTLFSARGVSYLIDMNGSVVQTWKIGTTPRLLDNGNLLDASRDDPSGFQGFKELDWNGKVAWQYTEKRAGYFPHHDWVRIYNKKLKAYTTLYIANRSLTHDQAIAAGCDPRNGPYRGAQMDAIIEIDMAGNVVWEWWFFDHVVQDIDATKTNYVGTGKTIADYPGRINLNLPGRPVKRDWLHCNSLDYNAELGQIVINSVQGEFYVIDHDKTFVPGDPKRSIALAASPAGDFLYRFGDPARYAQGDRPSIRADWTQATTGHKQIGGSHDIQWIRPGLPGAGNFLIFNNGQYLFERTAQSYIFEVNGFVDSRGRDTGQYVNPPDAGYTRWHAENRDTHKHTKLKSNQIVWMYYSKSNQGFFSHIGSGAQRLPNGNTLICAMTEGHIFEVTAGGEVVWEYINPVTTAGTLKVISDAYPMSNAVFRAYRYGPDHPALKGRDLTPLGTITDKFPREADQRGGRGQRPSPGGGRGRDSGRDGRDDRDSGAPRGDDQRDARGGPNDRGGQRGRRGKPRHPVHAALDANGDGEISSAEITNAAAVLKKLDANGDGWIRREEMRPPGGGRGGQGRVGGDRRRPGGERDRPDNRRGEDDSGRDERPRRDDR